MSRQRFGSECGCCNPKSIRKPDAVELRSPPSETGHNRSESLRMRQQPTRRATLRPSERTRFADTRQGSGNLASVKPRRYRDKDHLRFVAAQPCTVCGRQPCEAHHLRFAQPRALGRRVSDEFTVPLCRVHHRELHRQGDERAWWNKANIDPMPIALGFWQQTRGVLRAAS